MKTMPNTLIKLKGTYKARSIRPLNIWEHRGWHLKMYGITEQAEFPRPAALEAGQKAAMGILPACDVSKRHYGVGFLGIHDAAAGCYLFVDWWADENELHHYPFVGPSHDPGAFEAVKEGSIACTWDLALIAFERDAWVREVLARPDGPSLNNYLNTWLSKEI